jgi:hypothetical protein
MKLGTSDFTTRSERSAVFLDFFLPLKGIFFASFFAAAWAKKEESTRVEIQCLSAN